MKRIALLLTTAFIVLTSGYVFGIKQSPPAEAVKTVSKISVVKKSDECNSLLECLQQIDKKTSQLTKPTKTKKSSLKSFGAVVIPSGDVSQSTKTTATAGVPLQGGLVIDCPGSAALNNQPNINFGNFWPASTNLGTKFFYEFWAMPRNAGSSYMLSDGNGGAHAALLGFFQSGAGTPNNPQGNVYSGTSTVTFGSDDGVGNNEWAHVAYGWDGTYVYTYIDGVPVGRTAFGGPRQSPPVVSSGGGNFNVCGSDHSNFNGRIAMLRGFENANPLGLPEHAFAPETSFGGVAYDNAGNFTTTSILVDFSVPSRIIPDLSAGYNGRTHPGMIFNATYGTDYGFPQNPASNYPKPMWVNDPTAPTSLVTSSLLTSRTLTPATVPNGAVIFDSFSRNNQTFAFDQVPTLGSTEGGTLGPLPWNYGCAAIGGSITNCQWGILAGQAVPLGSKASLAWVQDTTSTQDVSITRHIGTYNSLGLTGLAFRVKDANNFWGAYVFGPNNGATIRLERFANGVVPDQIDIAAIASWYTLRIVANGSTFTVYNDATQIFTTTTIATPMTTSTGVGIFTDSIGGPNGITSLARFINFTVK
ncbi:MAG: hypothetical protein NVSMB66_6220 [Candidatus Doudnabacteria bacterium]